MTIVMKKNLYILVILIISITAKGKAQVYFTVDIGNKVVYSSSSVDADSTIKKQYAQLCDKYIKTYYYQNNLPLVFLKISKSKFDLCRYEIAYDNLAGYPSNYRYYGMNKNYNNPGIRIMICNDKCGPENLLKLLDYGINNLKKLKSRRVFILKQDKDRELNSLSLIQDEVMSIIKNPVSSKIRRILNN